MPLWINSYITRVKGGDLYINGVPPWCDDYSSLNFVGKDGLIPIFKEEVDLDFIVNTTFASFISNALAYFLLDVAWMVMIWSSASIGTPTEPMRRDVYIR